MNICGIVGKSDQAHIEGIALGSERTFTLAHFSSNCPKTIAALLLKPILNHFKPYIAQNIVHALDLKCMTNEQAKSTLDTAFDPHSEKKTEFFGVHIRRENKE